MKKIALATTLAATLLLSGCAADSATHDHSASQAAMSNEQMFVQMMIPHHQQALDMVALAEKNTSTPAILKLSEGIKNAQTAELASFRKWLADKGFTESSVDMGMDSGLLSDEEMAALAAAKEGDFDALFLEGMIKHHQGAVDMSIPMTDSTDTDVATWAKGIYVGQQGEILVMQALQRKM